MKREELMDALNLLPDQLILEANEKRQQKPRTYRVWMGWAAAAACTALAIWGGSQLLPGEGIPVSEPGSQLPVSSETSQDSSETSQDSSEIEQGSSETTGSQLPMITLPSQQYATGFEGYMVYDIGELTNANPWTEEASLSVLPVFENPLAYGEYEQVPGADFAKMEAFLREVAGRLGLDAQSLTVTDNAPDEGTQESIRKKYEKFGMEVPEGTFDPTQLEAKQGNFSLTISRQMVTSIRLEEPVQLPEPLRFSRNSSPEELEQVAAWIMEQYAQLLDMEDPQLNIFGGDYSIIWEPRPPHAEQKHNLSFFEGSGDLTDRILQYNFFPIQFYCNDEGLLYLIRIWQPDLSVKLGDYPIITVEEATRLLEEGHYDTSVATPMPGLEYLGKVELVYRTSGHDTVFLPYYRFYVELPEMKREDGLKDYGAYYVPAVQSQYLTNLPVYHGEFN